MALGKVSRGKGSTSRLVWDVSELNKINLFLENLKKRGKQAMRGELAKIARDIRDLAKKNVPVLTGRLQASGRIQQDPPASDNKFTTIVIFGGMAVSNKTGKGSLGSKFVDYAEKVELNHPSKSRYLARAMNTFIPQMEGRIEAAVKKHFKSGFKA